MPIFDDAFINTVWIAAVSGIVTGALAIGGMLAKLHWMKTEIDAIKKEVRDDFRDLRTRIDNLYERRARIEKIPQQTADT